MVTVILFILQLQVRKDCKQLHGEGRSGYLKFPVCLTRSTFASLSTVNEVNKMKRGTVTRLHGQGLFNGSERVIIYIKSIFRGDDLFVNGVNLYKCFVDISDVLAQWTGATSIGRYSIPTESDFGTGAVWLIVNNNFNRQLQLKLFDFESSRKHIKIHVNFC